jgi:hypothetical protein
MIYIMYPTLNIIPLRGKNVNPNLSDDDKIKKGKAPAVGDGFQEEENFETNNQLTRNGKAPMYGILTGKANNLIVVDYDIYNEKYNQEHNINLKTLKTLHGAGAYIVQTQRGASMSTTNTKTSLRTGEARLAFMATSTSGTLGTS